MRYVVPIVILVMAAAYLVFLAALWTRISRESSYRENKLDALLDKFPKSTSADS